jgi:heat shock protein HtpX
LHDAQREGLALDSAPETTVVVGDQLGAVLVAVVFVSVISEVLSRESRPTGDEILTGDDEIRPDEYGPAAVRRRLARLAKTADVPVPELALVEDGTPRAYVTGVRQGSATVVVSTGLLEVVSDEELDAVLAHELAHVKNRDAGVMTLTSLPTLVGGWLLDRGSFGSGTLGGDRRGPSGATLFYGLAVRPVAWLFWWVGRGLTRVLTQYREFAADRGAVAITGSPAAMASALQTLDRAARERPTTDLRAHERAKLGFNVVPVPEREGGFDPEEYTGFAVNEVDGGVVEEFDDTTDRVSSVTDLPTHPTTSERVARLRDLEADL